MTPQSTRGIAASARLPIHLDTHPATHTLQGLEEHLLEDLLQAIQPGQTSTRWRLEGMHLQRGHSLSHLVGALCVRELHLHDCTLDAAAWEGLAEGVRLNRYLDRPGLSGLSFCAAATDAGLPPEDITVPLSGLLHELDRLEQLTLGRVRFRTAPVLEAMKGKVECLTLDHLNGDSFMGTEADRPASPDIRQLRLSHWQTLPQTDHVRRLACRALQALVTDNRRLELLELHAMNGNLGSCEVAGYAVGARTTPVTVHLDAQACPGEEARSDPPGRYQISFMQGLTAHGTRHARTISTLHMGMSTAFLDATWALPFVAGIEALHLHSGTWVLPDEDAVIWHLQEQQRANVLAMPALEVMTLSPSQVPSPDDSHGATPAPRQAERDATWAPVLNALVRARASRHFMENHGLANAEVRLPADLTPALLDLPARPGPGTPTEHLHRLTRVDRESYNTWVRSVDRARAELPASSTRHVPALTRLPTDNA